MRRTPSKGSTDPALFPLVEHPPPPFGAGTGTATETGTEWAKEFSVPLTVTAYVPGVALAEADTVKRAAPPEVKDSLSREAVTPPSDGATTTDTVTAPEPFTDVVVTVLAPLDPCGTDSVPGEAAMVKSGTGTVTSTVVACVFEPSVPTTETV